MRDVRLDIHDAIERQDNGAIENQKALWRKRAAADWSSMSKKADECGEPRRKRYRGKAYSWLLSSEQQLWACTGRRFKDWCFDCVETRPPWASLPTLSINIDQGCDGWTSCDFLLSRSVSIVAFKDLAHRMWNDCWNAMCHCGLKSVLLLAICVLNADHGPWTDARWLQEPREAAEGYIAAGCVDDALFQRVYLRIVDEMNLATDLEDPELPRRIFQSIPEAVARTSRKVATSRWFGLLEALESFIPQWSRRFLLLSYLGKEMKLFDVQEGGIIAKRSLVRTPQQEGEEGATLPTGQESLDLASLRRACHNTLHLSCLFLGDLNIKQVLLAVTLVLRPLRAEHQWQVTTMKSCQAAVQVYREYSRGRGRHSLQQMIDSLYNDRIFSTIGLHDKGRVPAGVRLQSMAADLDT